MSQENLSVDFSSFVISLATQAMMLLGEIENPETKERAVNTEAARQTIDILGMLEDKTRNNLSADEQKLLGDVLASLRMAFVSKVKK